MTTSVESASSSNADEVLDFLRQHEDYTLFLLSNWVAHGPRLTDAPNSGNYYLIREGGEVRCVFALTKRGNLLVHSELGPSSFDAIAQTCAEEPVPLRGLIGAWEVTAPLWEFFKEEGVITEVSLASKDVLYTTSLELSQSPDPRVRYLLRDDFEEWRLLNRAYLEDQRLPQHLSDDQLKTLYLQSAGRQLLWGLFIEGELAAIAELNAKALDLGQLGGVFTASHMRKRGLGSALVRQLMVDCRDKHQLRKLVFFTGEANQSARRVYESLPGVRQVGYFALFFGS